MNAKLLIDGKEFDIEILDPELQKLLTPSKKKTGYERIGKSERHYYATDDGGIDDFCEDWDEEGADACYNGANYYSDKTVAENNSRADKLMRQLRRFAVEHREKEINWEEYSDSKWTFFCDYDTRTIDTTFDTCTRSFGNVYFDTVETAQLAIDTFCDELIWYFTEYKDSL